MEILERCKRFKSGPKFERLFGGSTADHGGDDSAADAALLEYILFANGGHVEQAVQIAKTSMLFRDKWKEPRGDTDYIHYTAKNILGLMTEFFEPGTKVKVRLPEGSSTGEDDAAPESDSVGELFPLDAGEQHLPTITGQAWERLIAHNDRDPANFLFGNTPTHIGRGEHDEPLPQVLDVVRLSNEMSKVTQWHTWSVRNEKYVTAAPPSRVMRNMLAERSIPLPVLRGIVEAPVFAPNGSLSLEPGYNRSSQLIYVPHRDLQDMIVPEAPTDIQLAEAIGMIDMELLGDFPFTGNAERAHAISYLLLHYCREMISGPTPIHLFERPVAGTGASLLISIGSLIASGRFSAMITEGRDEDEWRKRITATLLDSPMFVAIDNLRATLDSAAISSVITADIWKDRRLGANEMVRIPVRCVWAASGNNPSMSSEIARRVIRILDPFG